MCMGERVSGVSALRSCKMMQSTACFTRTVPCFQPVPDRTKDKERSVPCLSGSWNMENESWFDRSRSCRFLAPRMISNQMIHVVEAPSGTLR